MLKKFRLVISITLAFFLGLCFAGCSSSETASASTVAKSNGLVEVSRTYYDGFNLTGYTFYDPDTKVMYLYINDGKSGGLTVMVNEYGKPKLYQPQD